LQRASDGDHYHNTGGFMTSYRCKNCKERFALEIARKDSERVVTCPFCHQRAVRCAYGGGCSRCGGVLRSDGLCYSCGRVGGKVSA